jgi:hypothetical protein
MPEQLDQQATLSQGVETFIHKTGGFRPCRVTVTGIAGEFTTIPFKIKRARGADTGLFEAREVKLSFIDLLRNGRAEILATAPEGVGALDIVYDVRTGADA